MRAGAAQAFVGAALTAACGGETTTAPSAAAEALPVMTVRIWHDDATYFNELVRYFGVRYQAAGYITGPAELRVLGRAPAGHQRRPRVRARRHTGNQSCVRQQPAMVLGDGCLYENVKRVAPRSLDYLVRGAFPTLQQLNADANADRQVYEVGYLLGEFIVTRRGRATFVELIRTNANLSSVLGLSAPEFETAWQAFVRQRYF